MGGGHHESYAPPNHHTFKEVWSPSGGWWPDPKGWRRNTAIAVGVFLGVQYMLFKYSAEHEKRYMYPKHWVPAMMYTKNFPPKPEEAGSA